MAKIKGSEAYVRVCMNIDDRSGKRWTSVPVSDVKVVLEELEILRQQRNTAVLALEKAVGMTENLLEKLEKIGEIVKVYREDTAGLETYDIGSDGLIAVEDIQQVLRGRE